MNYNTTSECIDMTSVLWLQCMVVKFYNYTNTKRIVNDTLKIPVHVTCKTKNYQLEVFLHCLNSTCSEIKLITISTLLYVDKTIGGTLYMYLVASYI